MRSIPAAALLLALLLLPLSPATFAAKKRAAHKPTHKRAVRAHRKSPRASPRLAAEKALEEAISNVNRSGKIVDYLEPNDETMAILTGGVAVLQEVAQASAGNQSAAVVLLRSRRLLTRAQFERALQAEKRRRQAEQQSGDHGR